MTPIPGDTNFPPLPLACVIQIHDASPERLVLSIEPGRGADGIGFFALVWNLFMAVFTAFWVAAFLQQKANDGKLFVVIFLAAFWLIGLGFLFAWLKLKFERCLLSVELDRLILRRVLLGWQRQAELPLDESSRAMLTESYKQNDVPVYRVTVAGLGGNLLHFGTSLSPAEKDWSVDAINALLKPAAAPGPALADPPECEACGARIPVDAFRSTAGFVICPQCEHQQPLPENNPGSSAEIEAASDLPEELPGIVTVLESSPDRLGLQLRLIEQPSARWAVGLFAICFSLFWYAVSGGAFSAALFRGPGPGWNIIPMLFAVPFLCAGLVPLGLGIAAFRGRLTTWIDHQEAVIRAHVGPYGRSWTAATQEITAVRLANSSEMSSRTGNSRIAGHNSRVQGSSQLSQVAALCCGPRILAMTALHQPLTARYVVKLVCRWLSENAPRQPS